jgi:hypothetical protein
VIIATEAERGNAAE